MSTLIKVGGPMSKGSDISQSRAILRESFGRSSAFYSLLGDSFKPALGGFRVAMNAGNIVGPSDQTSVSTFAGNPRFVYDASDYIKYKKNLGK